MFSGGFESLKLKSTFREKFRNISKIMDCVGCDKCRLWGKLQVNVYEFNLPPSKSMLFWKISLFLSQIQGLGTALKILFSGKFDTKVSQTDEDNDKFKLRRGEIVSLLNAFGRWVNENRISITLDGVNSVHKCRRFVCRNSDKILEINETPTYLTIQNFQVSLLTSYLEIQNSLSWRRSMGNLKNDKNVMSDKC